MIVKDHLLAVNPGDEQDEDLEIEHVGLKQGAKRDPNKIDTVVIRGTGTPNATSARNLYKSGQNLVHLILGDFENKIIQTTDFNRRAGSGFRFETTKIIIGLVNVGYLIEFESQRSHYRHMDNFDPEEQLLARGANDHKRRLWPCFPDDQLDLLLRAVETLMINYPGIKFVESYEELRFNALQPGPAFPMVSFIERLRSRIPTLENKARITRRAAKTIQLWSSPIGGTALLTDDDLIEEGTLVSVVDEYVCNTSGSSDCESPNWSLIEVLGDEENPWLKGWVKSGDVQITPFKAKINEEGPEGHMLETIKNAAFPFIPAGRGNFNARRDSNKPKYLVMHLTTGTQIQSTINTFRNSGNGVSTHLVIGRDGRVIQMVPFNHAAYHCGTGSWEKDKNLNRLSIGIELDNAGKLTEVNGNWTKRKHIIPRDRVLEAQHRKDPVPRMYESYTDVQLDAARWVAEALIEHYQLEDILGHDQISPDRRYDPGPLFPMKKWREKFFDRPEAEIKKYKIKADTAIFRDYEGVPPEIPHPRETKIKLKDQQFIRVLDKKDKDFWLIKVKKGSKPPVIGWVKKDQIKKVEKTKYKIHTKEKVLFYRRLSAVGPPRDEPLSKPLLTDTDVQVMKVFRNLALVVTIADNDTPLVKGWIEHENLEPSVSP